MASQATSKSVIYAETKVPFHTIFYDWDIKHFDRIWTPLNDALEPIHSDRFRGGADINRESEWELMLSGASGHLQIWLYLRKISPEVVNGICVHFTLTFLKMDGVPLFRRRCEKNQVFTPQASGWGMNRTLSFETLWDERDQYLADNTLRIRIQLDILGDLITQTIKEPLIGSTSLKRGKRSHDDEDTDEEDETNDNYSTMLLKKDLRNLLESQHGADFILECDGKKFPVHKALLEARSVMFETLLKDTYEGPLQLFEIDEIPASALSGMLNYFYTGDIDHAADVDHLISLIEAGDIYAVDDMKDKCFKRLCEKIDNHTIGRIAITAYKHNAEVEVRQGIRNYCQSNFDTLVNIKDFKDCLMTSPRAFFEDISPRMFSPQI